jgi:hypothetical protein
MPTKNFDISINVVSPKKVKGISSGVAQKIRESPDFKKSGERVAVTGSTRLEEERTDDRERRRDLQRLVSGYSALEEQLSNLIDKQAEVSKEIDYRFDPDVEHELMQMLGKYFGTSEPVITSKMYAKMAKLMSSASAELSKRLVVK